MNERSKTRRSRAAAWTLSLVLLFGVTGCAQAINTGLGLMGLKSPGEALMTGRTAGRQITSTYRHTPTLTPWTEMAVSLSPLPTRLFEDTNLSPYCQAVPSGLTQILAVPGGTPSQPIGRLGPLEAGIAGDFLPTRALFDGDGTAFARQALTTSTRFGAQGATCGYSVFMYLRLTGSSGTERVSVLR